MLAGRHVRHVLGLASSLLIAVAAVLGPAAHAEVRSSRAVPAPVLSGTGVLDDVVAITPRNAWAVGHQGNLSHPKSLIEHWNGHGWQRIPVRPAAGWLDGVAATSARDVWAVGLSGSRVLILHFDGTSWRRVPGAATGSGQAILAGVTAISPRNAWAAGITGNKSLIEHWNGVAWKRVPSPSPQGTSILSRISAASARDIWAVGGANKTLILHWNGTRWRQVTSPSPGPGAALNGVTVISRSDAWAAGQSARGTLILRWNGSTWRRARTPAVGPGTGLIGISGTSAHNVWAVGATAFVDAPARAGFTAPTIGGARLARPAAAPGTEPVILHWNGARWQRVSIPEPADGGMLIGASAASGHNVWAVGCTKDFASVKARPLVLHWNGAAWK
jgi:hypothetical protein